MGSGLWFSSPVSGDFPVSFLRGGKGREIGSIDADIAPRSRLAIRIRPGLLLTPHSFPDGSDLASAAGIPFCTSTPATLLNRVTEPAARPDVCLCSASPMTKESTDGTPHHSR